MKIYALADIHSRPAHIATIYKVLDRFSPDLVVAAGDLTNFFNWRTGISQLDSLPVKVLAIRGNTDFKAVESGIARAGNMELLTPVPRHINGFSFTGTGGTLVLPFASRICLREKERLEMLPNPMDEETVLVVHPPPRGTLDRVAGRFSSGSTGLRTFIRQAQPGLMLCGHVHEQPGKAMIGRTTVVNCSMGKSGAGAIIHLEKGTPPLVNLLHPDTLE
ncbi:MAG: metallophosphoesterase family protein [Desulfobacterales bacterium]|nr:metallophosphoesterase family protein [Desulfobacterales bacterium]